MYQVPLPLSRVIWSLSYRLTHIETEVFPTVDPALGYWSLPGPLSLLSQRVQLDCHYGIRAQNPYIYIYIYIYIHTYIYICMVWFLGSSSILAL